MRWYEGIHATVQYFFHLIYSNKYSNITTNNIYQVLGSREWGTRNTSFSVISSRCFLSFSPLGRFLYLCALVSLFNSHQLLYHGTTWINIECWWLMTFFFSIMATCVSLDFSLSRFRVLYVVIMDL